MTRDGALERRLTQHMKSLTSGLSPRQIHELFPVKAADGSTPIAIAESSELVSEVTSRVSALGGTANVLVIDGDKTTRLTVTAVVPHHVDAKNSIEIPNNITMGMFVSYLKVQGDVSVHVHHGATSVEGIHAEELELTR